MVTPMSARAIVLYDRDCRFCVTIVDVLLTWDRHNRLESCAIQSEGGQRLLTEIAVDERLASFHLVRPGLPVVSGGPALAELLGLLPAGAPLAALLRALPGPTAGGYGWIARHRISLSRPIPGVIKERARRRVEAAERER